MFDFEKCEKIPKSGCLLQGVWMRIWIKACKAVFGDLQISHVHVK